MAFITFYICYLLMQVLKTSSKIKWKYVLNEWTEDLNTEMNLMGILELQSTITNENFIG